MIPRGARGVYTQSLGRFAVRAEYTELKQGNRCLIVLGAMPVIAGARMGSIST